MRFDSNLRRMWVLRLLAAGALSLPLLSAGCAGPGPKLLPASPIQTEQTAGGDIRWYDTDKNGQADFGERLGQDGRIREIRYRQSPEEIIDLDSIPAAERRELVIILDSVPYSMVQEAWQKGMLRYFGQPTKVIAPFPVMTDPSLIDFFHLTPGVAIESDYYDGQRETDAYSLYLKGQVATWHQKVDFFLPHTCHGSAYLNPVPWFDHELRRIQDEFTRSDQRVFVGYCVGTSALGAIKGRQGHELGLARMDQFCREMIHRTRGRVQITLLSDHGHNLITSDRIPLARLLRQAGYNVTDRLNGPKDIVVPEFAMVTCAAIYTRDPAPVAADAVKIEGIELAAYRDGQDGLIVLNRQGRARVIRAGEAYRYEALDGDPLSLIPVLDSLKQAGKVGPDGFVADAVLAQALQGHVYPDALDRLWRPLHDQYQHKPDVVLSVVDGKHCGSKFQSDFVGLEAAHGNLRQLSTFGFAVTNAGDLPPTVRMRELAPTLARLGVNVLN